MKNRAMSAESAYGVLNTTIVSIKELAQEYFGFAKAVATGRMPISENPPIRQKVGGNENSLLDAQVRACLEQGEDPLTYIQTYTEGYSKDEILEAIERLKPRMGMK